VSGIGPGLQAAIGPALGRNVAARPFGPAIRRWLARGYPRRAACRVALVYEPRRIAFAQAYPFLHHAPELRRRFGAAIRFFPVACLPDQPPRGLAGADIVLVQAWFTTPAERLHAILEAVHRAAPAARVAFLDSFAPLDLRLARHVAPHVDFYVKKSLFRDRARHLRAYRGDTNVMEHYGDLLGIAAEPTDFDVPAAILPRLRLCPNFFTAPGLLPGFLSRPAPDPAAPRPIDVQARLTVEGGPIYRGMRELCLARLAEAPGLVTATGAGLPWAAYMREMRAAKLCLSPFGYGELCWRDIEAFLAGSTLVKPDMSHLETAPDLYRPWETYVPCRWDFADLPELLPRLAGDPDLRARIAGAAFQRIAAYLQGAGFVEDMAFLFAAD